MESPQFEETNTPILYREYGSIPLPQEKPIDPETYLLGPGDRLRINITGGIFEEIISKEWSIENIDNFVLIDPAGLLFVPKIGSINTTGKTLADIERELNTFKKNIYKEALITVTLLRFREFKVLVHGAVNQPKFVNVTPITRLVDILDDVGGVQKYADQNRVILKRNGKEFEIYLKEFLLNGNLENNPYLIEGDVIYIPFENLKPDLQLDLTEYKRTQITVTGFIRNPRMIDYIPGYKVKDYVAMSGGTLDIGSRYRSKILRANGDVIHFANNHFVEPGDIIEIPESYTSIVFGNTGLVQAVTSVATLILAYQATVN